MIVAQFPGTKGNAIAIIAAWPLTVADYRHIIRHMEMDIAILEEADGTQDGKAAGAPPNQDQPHDQR